MVIKAFQSQQSTPLEEYPLEANVADVQLFIKRDDLIHPLVSGNKWRKLKYNFQYLSDNDYKGIISYGGAFSNHIFALASASRIHNLRSVGIIRGDCYDGSNPTLHHARKEGMELHFVSRTSYRLKEQALEVQHIISQYPGYYLLPEGGANSMSILGSKDLFIELMEQTNGQMDYIVSAMGTGATICGLAKYCGPTIKCVGIPVLKGEFNLNSYAEFVNSTDRNKIDVILSYHCGGYAKTNQLLIDFINNVYKQTGLMLDVIYTGKMLYGVLDLIRKGYFRNGSKIVAIHTGGLQGNMGFQYLHPGQINF